MLQMKMGEGYMERECEGPREILLPKIYDQCRIHGIQVKGGSAA